MEADTLKVLGFAFGDQWFAMEISEVKKVVEWQELTFVPKAPECALGVFNYHGSVITVIDPTRFFGVGSAGRSPDTRIIILSGDKYAVGFRVDRADKIELVSRDQLRAGGEDMPEKGFIKAVVPIEDRLYNLVDSQPLLDAIEEEFASG